MSILYYHVFDILFIFALRSLINLVFRNNKNNQYRNVELLTLFVYFDISTSE